MKEEIDKEMILRHLRKISGIESIRITKRKKKFAVVPNETKIPAVIDVE